MSLVAAHHECIGRSAFSRTFWTELEVLALKKVKNVFTAGQTTAPRRVPQLATGEMLLTSLELCGSQLLASGEDLDFRSNPASQTRLRISTSQTRQRRDPTGSRAEGRTNGQSIPSPIQLSRYLVSLINDILPAAGLSWFCKEAYSMAWFRTRKT